ncbi:hypothetical protein KI387_030366 [Taxus chinensis]|uniref:Carotenoid cleavage dioxygenase n=1 Tax=Taxus chinensis TaxID=29808 RepID=A0AA38CKT4_TAXCH|nr:hypothetical protein KI387_030366 [Taxus chinensis]
MSMQSQVKDSKTLPVKYPNLVAWENVKQERWEGELEVDGHIPHWLNGTYLRNGPGMFDIGDYKSKSLFDGYATLVRLHFENGRLTGGHAQLQSDAYKAVKKNNNIYHREFSTLPKPSNIFKAIGNVVGMLSGALVTDNAIISVIRLGDGRVVCLTETKKGSLEIDPKTLETIGTFKYTDNIRGPTQSGHPMVFDKELITVLPDFINRGYNVIRMLAGTNERTLIGRVNCKSSPTPGWVHSFAVTDNYVVVPEMPMKYAPYNMLKGGLLKWHPESKAFIHIIRKETGETVASVEVPPFMTFHFINAYEEKGMNSVIVDCCEHNANPTIFDKLHLHELRSFTGKDVLPHSRIGRFTIPLDGSPRGKLETAMPPEEHGRAIDMCTINPIYRGKMYRYIDLKEKTEKSNWHLGGSIPSEPIFIGRPGAEVEDDGVVISLVSDKDGNGFALVLDGSTFAEIARAKLPYGLPYGLHGCWVPSP